MSHHAIIGETGRKYFTQMLNMAEDDLDPFQYRLLAHYVRWAGYGGIVQETLKETAKRIKMSEKKARSTRAELVEMGYLRTYEPTLEERGEGIAGIVEICDRWYENVHRYTEKAPEVNMPQVGGEAQVNVPQLPEVNMPLLEELKSIEEQKDVDAAKVSDDKPKRQPPKRSEIFKRIALENFLIADVEALDKTSAIRINQLESWLKHNSPGATIETLTAFYTWYDKQNHGAARPKDVAKFAEHFTAFRQQHLVQKRVFVPPEVVNAGQNIEFVGNGVNQWVREEVLAARNG